MLSSARPDPEEDNSLLIRRYRENVNLVSLAMLWALGRASTLGVAELEFKKDSDLRMLFQIVMLAQVIDDVLDARKDRSRALPSFATGGIPTSGTISTYMDAGRIRFDRNFCLQIALRAITASARVVAIVGRVVSESRS